MQKRGKDIKVMAHEKIGLLRIIFMFSVLIFISMANCGCDEALQSSNNSNKFDKSLIGQADRILQDGLNNQDPRIRTAAIEAVAATKKTEYMNIVSGLLKDEYVPVRFVAAVAVGDTEYRPAESDLKKLLKAPDENSQIAAAYALAKLGHNRNLDIIRKEVKNEDQTVRANAVMLLGKVGKKEDLKLLYSVKNDETSDDKVVFQTVEAIAALGDERIFDKLWAVVLSTYADDKILGIRAMGKLGTPKAKDVLITKLDDDVLEVRLAAAEQLGMLGDMTGEPEVMDVFTKDLTNGLDKAGKERVYTLTALAIGQIRTPKLEAFLPELLQNESNFVRLAAAKAVFLCAKN